MKMLVLPMMLLSLAAGTIALVKTVEWMNEATAVITQATQPR